MQTFLAEAIGTMLGRISGGHVNPAVAIGLAAIGRFSWSQVPGYTPGLIS